MRRISIKRAMHLCTAFVFALILSTVIYSCRKELKIIPLSAADSVDAARAWYESTYPVTGAVGVNNKTTTLAVKNSNTQFDYSQHIKPDWNHNSHYKRFGKDVIELPVDPSRVLRYGLKNDYTGLFTADKSNSVAKFLLFNDGKNYSAYLMILIGNADYIGNDPSKMANNSFRKRDANFSGMVIYLTPKGKFLSAYRYQDGQIVPPPATGSSATATQQTQGVKVNDACSQSQKAGSKQVNSTKQVNNFYYCVSWYLYTYDQNDNLIGQMLLSETCDLICTGGGSPSGPGGGTTVPPLCQGPGTGDPPPPVGDTNQNSVAKQQVNDLGGGGGYPDPSQGNCVQQTQIDTTGVKKLITNLTDFTDEQIRLLDSVLNVLRNQCYGQALYNQLTNSSLTMQWQINPGISPDATYNPTTNVMTIKSAAPNFKSLFEELFHRQQNAYYSGGTAQYLNSPGGANIEFEIKVLRDMNNSINGGSYIMDNSDNYQDWINSLTGVSSQTATISYPTSFSSSQLADYYHYLADFVDPNFHTGYSNFTPSYTFPPAAIFSLLNSSGCPLN